MVERTNAPGLARTPGYSHAAAASGGRLVLTAGAVPLDAEGNHVGAGDRLAQARQVLGNLRAALGAAGAGPEDVLKTTVYVVTGDPTWPTCGGSSRSRPSPRRRARCSGSRSWGTRGSLSRSRPSPCRILVGQAGERREREREQRGGDQPEPGGVNRRYTVYLSVVTLAGWALASYDPAGFDHPRYLRRAWRLPDVYRPRLAPRLFARRDPDHRGHHREGLYPRSDRFRHVQEVKEARRSGDEERVGALLREYDVDVGELEDVTVKQLFTHPGYVRRQLGLLTAVCLFYSMSFLATNLYITDYLTRVKGFSGSQAGTLLLVSGGVGFLFYVLGGLMGGRWGRREVLIGTGLLVAPLNLHFLFVDQYALVAVVYFLIYQVTNGTWSGAGYAYQAESFPTRVRGTAVGFLGAMFAWGLLVGAALWTLLIGVAGPTVTWLIIAVGLALGQALTLFLRKIPPGKELEEIAT